MRILFIGDVIGKPGREIIKEVLPDIKKKHATDLVIANGENSAHGFGITPSIGKELFNTGVDLITSGNHIWKKKDRHF